MRKVKVTFNDVTLGNIEYCAAELGISKVDAIGQAMRFLRNAIEYEKQGNDLIKTHFLRHYGRKRNFLDRLKFW